MYPEWHGHTPPIKSACIFVTMRYHYTYSTSINMSKTIKVAFLLHLLSFDVAFSKTQTECECVTKAGIIPKHTSC